MFNTLKSVDTLTINDYRLFERTDNPKYLCVHRVKAYKQRDLDKLLEQIAEGLTGKNDFDRHMSKENHKIKSVYRLEKLFNYYQILVALITQNNINSLLKSIGKRHDEIKTLEPYVGEIKEMTGIDCSDLEGLERLKKKIQFYSDKYTETFSNEPKEGLTFMQIVMGVFAATGRNIQYDMYMSDFFIEKEQAEKIAKKWQTE